jgi:antitoxin (DNA-binding transcriptional repressor) of toxin-antitoxin stability system
MVAVNTSDLVSALPDVIARVRRGESVLLVENGEPVAQVGPAPEAEGDEMIPWWRGTYAPEILHPSTPGIPATGTVAVERRLPEINASWYRGPDDDD